MNLYRNGFVVSQLNNQYGSYNAWPLSDLSDDLTAESLTNEADDRWFIKYDIQHIIPDLNFIKGYYNYCKSINLDVKVLLFESLNSRIVVDDKIEIKEVLGFDCIGTVYYSYLHEEYSEYRQDLLEKNITLNRNGLFDSFEEVLYFVELRKKAIASGINIEDFWDETIVKISIVDI